MGSLRRKTRFRPSDLSVAEWAYLAGIIDGEGSITQTATTGRWSLLIANTDTALMEWLAARIPGCISERRHSASSYQGRDQGTFKPVYTWQSTTYIDTWLILRCVYPYLVIKREKAAQAISQLHHRIFVVRDHKTNGAMLHYLQAAG